MAYNRLPGSGHNSPSPPQSPLRSPNRLRHSGSRSKQGRFNSFGNQPPRTLAHRLAWFLLSVLLRRQGVFLFAPLLYIAGMLFYMGTISFDHVPVIKHRPPAGSLYRTPQLYAKLRPQMDADNSSSDAICNAVAVAGYLNATLVIPNFHYHSIWKDPRPECPAFLSCGKSLLANSELPLSHLWKLSSMLATLFDPFLLLVMDVGSKEIPHCYFHTIKFKDIYDEEYFLSTLENDVRIVDRIPEYIMDRFDHNLTNIFNFRIKAWSPIQYYKDTVLPKLLEEKAIRISPFANRLSFDAPPPVQRLRCLANYEALRFSNPILTIGESLVAKMKERSANNSGKYVSVHLRFEEDMVAFSCCVFDGGAKEKIDMDAAREKGWKGKFTKPGRVIRPGLIRINGKCPLTPLELLCKMKFVVNSMRCSAAAEPMYLGLGPGQSQITASRKNANSMFLVCHQVGLLLRGMGFDKSTAIYLASGRIYDAERNMAPLFEMFPLLQTKEMLASPEELAPFMNYSSRMAAIDYTVCLHSEVFVTTQGGNFPHFLFGHRRYLYGGHSQTIKPDKRKLVQLLHNTNIGWKSFKRQMLNMRAHSDLKGIEIKRPNDSIYSVPCPSCMCLLNKTEDS
ncbi:hypothetical protein TEA_006934 [Camellia sinensis var. sinensis]|uniref:O-fucosyltransferase family protein n=1 Tax=Camellia sinensis var. sinensis TaxID=542762 RepID=A0A4S4DC18_CAMSN|nr:hypothetical protein TEA_006934 [Camellia sinensis var. sinensis]